MVVAMTNTLDDWELSVLSSRQESALLAARLDEVLRGHREICSHIISLYAAETLVSDDVRTFLVDQIYERYAMGAPAFPQAENFIGAKHVLDLRQLTIDLCRERIGAMYADPRLLSSTSAVTNLLMTLSEPGTRNGTCKSQSAQ